MDDLPSSLLAEEGIRLEVWSFNHDYFVEQSSKKFGVEPFLGFRY